MTEDQTDGVVQGIPIRQVVDALPRAIIVTDGAGRIVLWNQEAERLYGWSEAEALGRSLLEVLVPFNEDPNVAGDSAELLARVLAGEPHHGDRVVLRRNGDPVRILASTKAIFDEHGAVKGVVGASEDITGTRVQEQRAADLTGHLRLALEAAGLGTWRWDMATGNVTWDEQMEALFGFPPGSYDGTFEAYVNAIHPDDVADVLATVNAAVEDGGAYQFEHRVVRPDGTVRWLSCSGRVTFDENGAVTGTIGCSMDATDRLALAADRAASAVREGVHSDRLRVLSLINDALSDARDRQTIMEQVTRAAVPRLGDWCSIYVLNPGSRTPDVETAHIDPAMVTYARELQERFPYDPAAPTGMPQVIRGGTPEFYPDLTDAVIDAFDADEDVLDVVRQLKVRSAMAVPLIKHGRVLGGMQFVMTHSSRRFTEDDLALAQAVAGRVASALENERLAANQRHIASTLQASLLPDRLPTVAGLDVAVRYWAVGEGTDVGGDFYDLFTVPDSDRVVAVIGDVCGNGPVAASSTALARHSIRQAAWRGDPAPRVLHWLNFAMSETHPGSFLTAAYAILAAAGAGFDVEVTCAGHPLPVVVRADGEAHSLGTPGSLIGVFDTISVHPVAAHLHPGDTLILYTDGVTDVPPPHLLTPTEVVELFAAATTGAADAESVVANIHTAIAGVLPLEDRSDDIALLVLHVPRPR